MDGRGLQQVDPKVVEPRVSREVRFDLDLRPDRAGFRRPSVGAYMFPPSIPGRVARRREIHRSIDVVDTDDEGASIVLDQRRAGSDPATHDVVAPADHTEVLADPSVAG